MSRLPKRLAVKFGPSPSVENRGFIIDLSARGVGLASNALHPVGTRLFLRFDLTPGKVCNAETMVAWIRPRDVERGLMGGMGLNLVTADNEFFRFLLTARATPRAEEGDSIPP